MYILHGKILEICMAPDSQFEFFKKGV
jgi:hypothetical protein